MQVWSRDSRTVPPQWIHHPVLVARALIPWIFSTLSGQQKKNFANEKNDTLVVILRQVSQTHTYIP